MTDIGGLDRIPDTNVYIGGVFTLSRKAAMKEANITHILTVLGHMNGDDPRLSEYRRLVIDADDVEDQNLIQYFPQCVKFIQDGLKEGSVFVHCAMGKSRSTTMCIAYLMKTYGMKPEDALERIREVRPIVEPNDGFMQQLDMYYRMKMTDDIEGSPIYQRWMYQREVSSSLECGLAPEADKIRFEDEHVSGDANESEFKCKKCRRTLATSAFLIAHQPPPHTAPFPDSLTCAHHFIDPLSWMRPELEKGLLEGRLECPKCSSNIGKYAWQGMKCSCGAWVVPAITIAKARVDEVRKKTAEGMGIRRGPGVEMPATRAGGRGLL